MNYKYVGTITTIVDNIERYFAVREDGAIIEIKFNSKNDSEWLMTMITQQRLP